MSEEREMERGDGEKGREVCNKQWREKVVVAEGENGVRERKRREREGVGEVRR